MIVKFGGRDIAEVGVPLVIENINRGAVIAPEISLWRRSGADGSIFVDLSLPSREIEVSVTLAAANAAAARVAEANLARRLLSQRPMPLEFSDEAGQYFAVLSAVSIGNPVDRMARGTVTFTCPDPFLFGDEVHAPLTADISTETNWHVEPRITLTVTATATSLSLVVNGEQWRYDGTLAVGSVVTIDTERRETRVNGKLRVAEVDGTYPVLLASNQVVLPAGVTASVIYQNRSI